MFERDNLSGIPQNPKTHWFIFLGKVLLWLLYMLPPSGYAGTRRSARWARSPLVTVIVASAFWLCLVLFIVIYLLLEHPLYG